MASKKKKWDNWVFPVFGALIAYAGYVLYWSGKFATSGDFIEDISSAAVFLLTKTDVTGYGGYIAIGVGGVVGYLISRKY